MLELLPPWEVEAYCHSSGVALGMLRAVIGAGVSCWAKIGNETRPHAVDAEPVVDCLIGLMQ